MKAQNQYLKFVKWEETDALYVGYCPNLFPWGGVCHAETEADAYKKTLHSGGRRNRGIGVKGKNASTAQHETHA